MCFYKRVKLDWSDWILNNIIFFNVHLILHFSSKKKLPKTSWHYSYRTPGVTSPFLSVHHWLLWDWFFFYVHSYPGLVQSEYFAKEVQKARKICPQSTLTLKNKRNEWWCLGLWCTAYIVISDMDVRQLFLHACCCRDWMTQKWLLVHRERHSLLFQSFVWRTWPSGSDSWLATFCGSILTQSKA